MKKMNTWQVDVIVEDTGESVTIEWDSDIDDEMELIKEIMHYISIVPISKTVHEEED